MKNNIFKKGIAVLLSAAMSICLYGCGSRNTKDAQDEIIDVIEATKEVFSDSLQKGVYDPLIENGQVNRVALYNNVEDTFNYELLEHDLSGAALDILDQTGNVTTNGVIDNAFEYEDKEVMQNWFALNKAEQLDYSKIYESEKSVETATKASDLEIEMNQAVNAGDIEAQKDIAKRANKFAKELMVTIPDDKSLANDFAWRVMLDLEDYVVNSDQHVISQGEERIFDHPIKGCMEAIYESLGSLDEFKKYVSKEFKIDASNMEKDDIIALIQNKYATDIVSFSDIIRAQFLGAKFEQKLDKKVVEEFKDSDKPYEYNTVLENLTNDIANSIEKGELVQNVYGGEPWVNQSKIGIKAPELNAAGKGTIVETRTITTYKTNVEQVDEKDVPANQRVPKQSTYNGRKGYTDDEAKEAFDDEARKAAEAASRGEDYSIPDDMTDTEKEQIQDVIDRSKAQREQDAAATPEVTYKDVPDGEEEVVDYRVYGGEGYNPDAENIDLTLDSIGEFEDVVSIRRK